MSAFRNEIVHGLGLSVLSFFIIYYLMKKLDPNNKSRALAREQTKQIIQKFKKTRKIRLDEFNDHEVVVTSHLIHQDDIHVCWEDIAGLDAIVESIKKTVLIPIMRTDLISKSNLSQPPKGVLLYGPPGCGKTMIAKAIAKECSLPFINLDVSTLTDKWYGESQKLATAVFSAAKKLSPCIVFIDEIESFLRSRNSSDHEATAMIKTQFMIHWDGLISDSDCQVVIMGATNRPEDIDKAFLRRMPATFHIPLPNLQQRNRILSKILEKEQVDKNVNIDEIAQLTEKFSGADLKEVCRTASVYRLSDIDSTTTELRNITMDDLMSACNKIKKDMTSC